MTECWYVSDRMTIHDERWLAALSGLDFTPIVAIIGQQYSSVPEARSAIAHASPEIPVLAGPLTTITRSLIGLPNRIVGLSWGFDLLETPHRSMGWLRMLDHLIVDSSETASIANHFGLDIGQITLLPWGVDLEVFQPEGSAADLSAYGVERERDVVLSLRAHESLYCVGDLIAAWPSVLESKPRAIALIGNSGSLTPAFHQAARDNCALDSIRFVGRLAESELPPLLRASSVYVTTSPVDGTSVTTLQAMACGTPVVATNIEANRSWLRSVSSDLLFEPGNVNELTEAITKAIDLSRSPLRQSMALRSRAEVIGRADWQSNKRLLHGVLRSTPRGH